MTQAQIATYRAALKEARAAFDANMKRLHEIAFESTELNIEVAKLRRTIIALSAMCSEEPMLDKLGITDSCIEVMKAENSTVTTNDVVDRLERIGFDLASQKNVSASVHAVLRRLARKGIIQKVETEGDSTVRWRGPNYDADFERTISEIIATEEASGRSES
jgi:hypothetical protein